jgi:hypothetical protein
MGQAISDERKKPSCNSNYPSCNKINKKKKKNSVVRESTLNDREIGIDIPKMGQAIFDERKNLVATQNILVAIK